MGYKMLGVNQPLPESSSSISVLSDVSRAAAILAAAAIHAAAAIVMFCLPFSTVLR